jgi:hypothetical protein
VDRVLACGLVDPGSNPFGTKGFSGLFQISAWLKDCYLDYTIERKENLI